MKSEIKPKVIIFDVYETLLDMSEVERRVNNLMDSRSGYRLWFEMFMQYCFVENCTVRFNSFDSIARVTMQLTGKYYRRKIDEQDINDVLDLLKHLPLKEGVSSGLSALHDKGYRISALTNSPAKTVLDRVHRTGLISYFEKVMSAEQVQKYKPCIEVYDWAAKSLNASPDTILLVSSHGWDIYGASNAGMMTAFIESGRDGFYPLAPEPDLICKDLEHLSEQLQ